MTFVCLLQPTAFQAILCVFAWANAEQGRLLASGPWMPLIGGSIWFRSAQSQRHAAPFAIAKYGA